MSETTSTPVAEAPQTDDTLSHLRSELRDAGEVGKKQWQEAFARTREAVTTTRGELERVAARTRDVASAAYSRAQARGADLLLRLVSQVRATAETVEASLRTRAASEPASQPDADAQPATA